MPRELWIPGPTEVSPDILAACAKPMIGHRSQAMEEMLGAITPGLRELFETKGCVLALTTAASGVMEAAIRNLVQKRVLCLVNGSFSQRWFEIAKSCGKNADALEIVWGEGFTGDIVEKKLRESGPYEAVTLVHNETSTGALSDLASVAVAMKKFPQTLFLVDTVSSLAGTPVQVDANRIDLCLAGSQKALALPPGLTVVAVSKAALEKAKTVPDRGWYFDLPQLAAAAEKNSTPATPATSLLFALRAQLDKVRANGGWAKRYEEHRTMMQTTDAWAAKHGFESFPKKPFRSPTTACLKAGSLDVEKFLAGMKEKGFVLSNGYGKLKGQAFRIGHMGDHTVAKLEKLLRAAEEVIAAIRK